MKKRIFCVVFVIVLALSTVSQAESMLSDCLSRAEQLLFSTENCSLSANAAFELDGENFKTLELNMALDGNNSRQQLILLSPRENGEVIRSGYTVYASLSEIDGVRDVYVLEEMKPGVYQHHYTVTREKPSLMALSSELQTLLSVGHAALDAMSASLPRGVMLVLREDGGNEVRVQLNEEQLPDLCHDTLTLLAKYAAKHFFNTDYDSVLRDDFCDPECYLTTVEALVACMDEVWLSGCDLTLCTQADGTLTAEGNVLFGVRYRDGSEHSLKVDFSASAGSFGSTAVPSFLPEENGILPYEHNQVNTPASGTAIDEEEALRLAEQVARSELLSGGESDFEAEVKFENGLYTVTLYPQGGRETSGLQIELRQDGSVRTIENLSVDWRHASQVTNDEDALSYREEIIRRLESFDETINPGSTAAYAARHPDHGASDGIFYGNFYTQLSDGSGSYLVFYTDRSESGDRKTMFVMQVLPQERLVYYDSDTDPEEGGNG